MNQPGDATQKSMPLSEAIRCGGVGLTPIVNDFISLDDEGRLDGCDALGAAALSVFGQQAIDVLKASGPDGVIRLLNQAYPILDTGEKVDALAGKLGLFDMPFSTLGEAISHVDDERNLTRIEIADALRQLGL